MGLGESGVSSGGEWSTTLPLHSPPELDGVSGESGVGLGESGVSSGGSGRYGPPYQYRLPEKPRWCFFNSEMEWFSAPVQIPHLHLPGIH